MIDLVADLPSLCDQNGMIDRIQMFDLMPKAFPNFSKLWDEFNIDHPSGPEDRLNYILIADIVRECSRMLANGERQHVGNVLEIVESWLIDGDPYVQEAATVGFIEDLQNSNLHEGTTPADFVPLLGPESSYWWKKVERFWSHSEPIVDNRQALS